MNPPPPPPPFLACLGESEDTPTSYSPACVSLGGGVKTHFHFFVIWFVALQMAQSFSRSENQANFFADEWGFTFNLSVVAFLHHLVILHRGLWFVQLSAKGRGLHSVFLFIYCFFLEGGRSKDRCTYPSNYLMQMSWGENLLNWKSWELDYTSEEAWIGREVINQDIKDLTVQLVQWCFVPQRFHLTRGIKNRCKENFLWRCSRDRETRQILHPGWYFKTVLVVVWLFSFWSTTLQRMDMNLFPWIPVK